MLIRIRQYQFIIQEPYFEGQTITMAEAQALNGVWAENIANNMRKVVEAEVATLPPDELLSHQQQAELQVKIAAYASKYKFKPSHSPGYRPGPIEREAEAIAEERLRQRYQGDGQGLTKEEFNLLLRQEILDPEVQAEARRRVAAHSSVAAIALEELL